MQPEERRPTHPGEILLEEFLKPRSMSQVKLALQMRVPIQRINTLIAGKRGVTPETAILLSMVFDTTPEFWMNLQTGYDLYAAKKRLNRKAA
ncbi:MAG: HigA family addiction module antitoxin [Candidatus Omnitrophica bacterium]|nr:HigA family addiction module antitoxin [Candidatus Omnitrophota bacterium]MDD5672142.1 HigA family addiction module antitoxin [Candidatus Omnitrophota bacterium]